MMGLRITFLTASFAVQGLVCAGEAPSLLDGPADFRQSVKPQSVTPQSVTLERAIDLALINNRDIMSSRIALQNSDNGATLSRNAFRTTFRPEGNASASDTTQSFFYGLNARKKFGWGTRLSGTAGYEARRIDGTSGEDGVVMQVELSQPLFRRMNRETILEPVDDARSDFRQAERALYLRQAEIMLEVFRSYEQILLLQRRIQSSEASFKRLDGLIELSKVREAQGRQSRVDSLRVELQRGQAQVRLQNDRERLDAERESFQDMLNLRRPVSLDTRGHQALELDLLIGILIHCGPAFWPYFERLSNIQPQFSPTDLARDARADPFVVAGFKWPPILHGFG